MHRSECIECIDGSRGRVASWSEGPFCAARPSGPWACHCGVIGGGSGASPAGPLGSPRRESPWRDRAERGGALSSLETFDDIEGAPSLSQAKTLEQFY